MYEGSSYINHIKLSFGLNQINTILQPWSAEATFHWAAPTAAKPEIKETCAHLIPALLALPLKHLRECASDTSSIAFNNERVVFMDILRLTKKCSLFLRPEKRPGFNADGRGLPGEDDTASWRNGRCRERWPITELHLFGFKFALGKVKVAIKSCLHQ